MYVAYNELPNSSRVWVYQANKALTAAQKEKISLKATNFIQNWTRHGDDLKGSFTIKYNQFLVLAVDESFNNVSGCSIDASVHFVQALEKELEVDFTNKLNVTFKDGDNINLVKLSEFKEYAKAGKITKQTIVFNNMVSTKKDFETIWEVTAQESWHSRFLV